MLTIQGIAIQGDPEGGYRGVQWNQPGQSVKLAKLFMLIIKITIVFIVLIGWLKTSKSSKLWKFTFIKVKFY